MIGEIIPVLGVLTGLIVPVAVFIWLYHEEKGKRDAVSKLPTPMTPPRWSSYWGFRRAKEGTYRLPAAVSLHRLSGWVLSAEQYLSAVF